MGTLKLDLAAFSASLLARDLIRMLSRLEGFFCFGIFPASIQVHFKMRLGVGEIKYKQSLINLQKTLTARLFLHWWWRTLGFQGETAPFQPVFYHFFLEWFGRFLGVKLEVVIRGDHSFRQLSGTDRLKIKSLVLVL
jgi:hypothetical protein